MKLFSINNEIGRLDKIAFIMIYIDRDNNGIRISIPYCFSLRGVYLYPWLDGIFEGKILPVFCIYLFYLPFEIKFRKRDICIEEGKLLYSGLQIFGQKDIKAKQMYNLSEEPL